MDAALGYTAEIVPALPPYLHLLGARREALPLLKHASLPLSHSLAKLEKENDACARMAAAQAGASDFGALRVPGPMGSISSKIIFDELTKIIEEILCRNTCARTVCGV